VSRAEAGAQYAAAYAALERGDWVTARAEFERALAIAETAQAYEGLSWAALGLDDGEAVIRARQAAYRLYRRAGDDTSAARMAMWAGKDHEDFRGELAVARGWRQRARRLLAAQPTSPEHGWLPLFECWAALNHGEDPLQVWRCAEEAQAVSRACDEPDIAILALAAQGLALVGYGDVQEGMARLDEAAAAVLGGELHQPIWGLPVLCWLIYACERTRDVARAAEWCEMMRDTADQLQHTASQGICRAHYAAVLTCCGRWDEAEVTLSEAADCFRASWPPHVAEAQVRLAELRRHQGRREEAEQLLRGLEWHPLAMLANAELALDSGRLPDAEACTQQFLRQIPQANRLAAAPGWELLVRVRAQGGEPQQAMEALEALESVAHQVGTLPLRAATCLAKAEVARASGEAEAARVCYEDAAALFQRSGAPFEAARARTNLAEVLFTVGQRDRAQHELALARDTMEQLNAGLWLRRIDALQASVAATTSPPAGDAATLTPRQREVLRLIAQGSSDLEIATCLGISEHTVHRHVANILQRLDVPTRAAAVARAATQRLI
jgi:DNA-binding CsgD family transcriptional regulator